MLRATEGLVSTGMRSSKAATLWKSSFCLTETVDFLRTDSDQGRKIYLSFELVQRYLTWFSECSFRMLSVLHLRNNSPVNVRYGENFDSATYKLLEVDEQLLEELLEHGLSIKGGGGEDEAVLCTSKSTYAIKFVSTSNTVLLVPPRVSVNSAGDIELNDAELASEKIDVEEVNAVATTAGHIELVEIAPQVSNLKVLLTQRPYKEDVDGETIVEEGEGLYTWEDLVTRVPASEFQLRAALKALQAVEIDRHWRIPDYDFMDGLLEMLLLNAIHHGWPLDALPEMEVLQVLGADNYSPQIVMHCLQSYGATVDFGLQHDPNLCSQADTVTNMAAVQSKWALDENKVCLHYASRLLASNANWKLDNFMKSWRKAVPVGMNPHLQMLAGEALVDVVGPESWLHQFSITSLPRKPEERFAALFKRRPKWGWEDLEPYLLDLKEPKQSVEAMLLKYTRKSQPSANLPPIYTSR